MFQLNPLSEDTKFKPIKPLRNKINKSIEIEICPFILLFTLLEMSIYYILISCAFYDLLPVYQRRFAIRSCIGGTRHYFHFQKRESPKAKTKYVSSSIKKSM